ncbi:hypothetical protein A6A04_02315 [Paramagnetospirillum marisnigri]|uniref:Uncharacterized protein n=1 Tax=Paramagnetospirillum marisnigri TaxID=1285242 RepID=A0A178MQE1_9PROT|nr:hypothetical protein [Paramagnetospirillum marisnigri]OAN50257.1 hypothetical protein A6A04_02315 [Paramagnetospirillum marisnigri]
MMRRAFRLALPLLAGLALAGCSRGTNLPPTSGTASDQPVNFQLVTDIPIPAGATMDNDRSLILSDRDRWTGRVVMTLSNSANEVTAFYQSQMPNFGWQPMMSVTAETSVLTYLRGDRAATVQVERRTVYGTTVSVTVAPKQSDASSVGYESSPAPRAAPSSSGGIRSEQLAPPASRR